MRNSHNSQQIQVNAGSMADIAFLLLIFFMITTTIVNDKGISLLLPPDRQETEMVPINERNLFKIQINSQDKLLVEGEPRDNTSGLREEIKTFILNNGKLIDLSESSSKAVVSIKTNRGTTQEMFIKTLDEVKAAYYEIYAQRAGITPAEYRNLSSNVPAEKRLYDKGRKGVPMNISIAEPSN
ncbi:hypothetical protein GCM10009122_26970 [Fulvivirga kasyanovii]|uniref:Biopolymer transporter ExbD n=1 Tax=Fulvivirga kasyanovii TaxID=396812 RepID=A0ABW9RR57_9BACT|nr:biopolymer transporter ExbD [Fulvivirga kasyanovii]MTI26672.1 biopolymer transporter ExbD [Fulvivirga kasyanovii]